MADNPQENAQNQPKATFNWDSLIDPSNGKILGKYDDPEVFKRSYWEQNNGAAELARENKALRELYADMSERISPREHRASRESYEDNLSGLGIPLGDLENFVKDRAKKEAEQLVQQRFDPLMKTMQARTEIAQEHPEYLSEEAKVMNFIQRSPSLQRDFNDMAQLNPLAALRYGYAMYREAMPRTPSAEQEQNRAAAALPNNVGQGANRTPFPQGNQQDLQQALGYYRTTRDEKPFLDAYFQNKPLTWTEQLVAQMKQG